MKVASRQKTFKRCVEIPIYDAKLWIVVADSIYPERKKFEHLFGPAPAEKDYTALACYSGGHSFGIFINRRVLCLKVVAHEVFHLTHRILDWSSSNFDSSHHEQGAMLHGYLLELVCRELKVNE